MFRPPPGLTIEIKVADDATAPPPPPSPLSPAPSDVKPNLCGAWPACATPGSDCCSTLAPSSGPSSPSYVPGRILQDQIAHSKPPAVSLSLDTTVEKASCGTATC